MPVSSNVRHPKTSFLPPLAMRAQSSHSDQGELA
jgi:hypothetical protein